MKLTELVTPVFLFVVAFRRKIRRNIPLDYSEVKREAATLFTRVEAQASARAMTDRWNRAKIALTYLVDEVAIMESWSGQESWNNHSMEIEYLGHDEKMRGVWFFDQEYKYAMDSGDVEMIEILYACLCLGFEGRYRGQTVQLKNHIDNLYSRLPIPYQESDRQQKMFAECYVVDRTTNDPRVPMRVATMVAVFLGIIVAYVSVTSYMYDNFVGDLGEMAGRVAQAP